MRDRERFVWELGEQILTRESSEYCFLLPEVTDISMTEGIRLIVEKGSGELSELEVTLYPLRIARPEFFPCIKGTCAVLGEGEHEIDIPFGQFEYWHMAGAFLSYMDKIAVRLAGGAPVVLRCIQAGQMGSFTVRTERASWMADAGEWVEYRILITNMTNRRSVINIHRDRYGKECLPSEYSRYVVLEPSGKQEYTVRLQMTEDIPAGGVEKNNFLLVPDGDSAGARTVTLYTSRRKEHPYLFLQAYQWQRRKDAILSDGKLYDAFCSEYVEEAERWRVPETADVADHVYPSYSQNGLFKTAVAWKITGRKAYLDKALRYICGFLDKADGYLATEKSYFSFIESEKEYARGDFKVHRAQNAGWVQEAEFFNKLAMTYDLLYDYFTPEQHQRMEASLRSYMRFAGWRLTDGDGNNFQVAEAGAGLLCAMALQDYEWIERFLYGCNGYMDLLSAVLLDDGMYFEEASGYVRLAGELFFDIVNAAENFGIPLKDKRVPASFDRKILHAPWAVREMWAEDGKPFLGMSFRRFEKMTGTVRSLKDYFDCTAKLLTDRGILFSVNDSNEQVFTELYKKAYYLYQEPCYQRIAALSDVVEPLFVPEDRDTTWPVRQSALLEGAGFGILRERDCQAVLKFGTHGGYHGHYDRLSLASFIKDNQTFHNNEYAWYGYDSFLFKMWVQTSVAHNMVVVDGRMQKPSPCQCIYYADQEEFCGVCAQTVTEWIDPPYGGQTPYPFLFPDEKCEREKRYVLKPEKRRGQGEIGEYSEPVFQRRLLLLFHGYCIVWDYLEGQVEHRYDCLYHPMGKLEKEEGLLFEDTGRFSDDPFGAGQFILNCRTAQADGPLCLRFHDGQARVNGNDIIDHMPEAAVWRAYPLSGSVTVGRYPQKGDSFTEENCRETAGYLEEPLKKTVSFTARGKRAGFITILEAGKETGRVRTVRCTDFDSVTIVESTEETWRIAVSGMDRPDASVSVTAVRLP